MTRERAATSNSKARAPVLAPCVVGLLAVATLLSTGGCTSGSRETATPPTPRIDRDWVVQDADWMMGAAIVGGPMDGAFGTYPDQQHVMPYFANLGAFGLARATQFSGDDRYLDAVWRHLGWYAGHMDGNGYVRDYDLINGAWYPAPNAINKTAPYDSTDSYAGTFLLALRGAYRVHHDRPKLAQLATAIALAITAIRSTQDSDGLTWARPGYRSKILMDVVEAYQGMLAGVELAGILGNKGLEESARKSADALRRGIESLWNPSKGYYYVEKDGEGSLESPRWSKLDPGAMSQAWAVSFHVAPPDRASKLMRELARNQPRWDQPGSNTLEDGYDVTPVGWAYWRIGNAQRALQAAITLRNQALADQRTWPFSFGTCGELIVLETNGTSLIFG